MEDGYPDLVVSNSEATLGVLLGNGDGTFQASVAYPWAGPGEIAIADVNGDGKPDLLLAHFFYVVDVQVVLNNAGAPPTAITVTPSVDPVDFNQVVTYTASVSGPSGGTLNGSVWFLDGGTPIATVTLADNQATYSTSYSAHKWEVGMHQITAAYSGTFQTAAGPHNDDLGVCSWQFEDSAGYFGIAFAGRSARVGSCRVNFDAALCLHRRSRRGHAAWRRGA